MYNSLMYQIIHMTTMHIIALMFFVGCSSAESRNDIYAEFKPYTSEFEALYGNKLPDIITYFDNMGPAASCYVTTNVFTGNITQRTLVIDRDFWEKSCTRQKRAIIFHELGHCVLDRGHAMEGAMTYMVPDAMDCKFYRNNEAALDAELF